MGRFVNPDNSAFQVALNSRIYVDKTGLLKYTNSVLDTMEGYICNSRPRRFGKSYAANMLAAYYSKGAESEQMFTGLEISKDPEFKKHLNKYDVIHIDVQWFLSNCKDVNNVVQFITDAVLDELRDIYPSTLPQNVSFLSDGLSWIREKTGQKFIIIIDEWDVLIRDEAMNKKVQEEYLNFLRGMFKGTEPTKYIQLAYLTGILPFRKDKSQSAVNNLKQYSMLSAGPLAPYVGFTEDEVKALCEKYNRDFDEVKRWYDGLKSAIIEMLSGDQVKIDVTSFQNDTAHFANRDDVITYLIHLGYLAYNQKDQAAFVPNEEIRQELIRATRRKKWDELILLQKESEELLDATLNMENEVVASQIEKIHEEYVSSIQYNNENSLSSVLTIAYLSALQYYFKPVRELPTGRGFADFVFIPKPDYINDYPALIVELKWNKSAKTALQQIKKKNTPLRLKTTQGISCLLA